MVLVLLSLLSLSVLGQETTQVTVGEESVEVIETEDTITAVDVEGIQDSVTEESVSESSDASAAIPEVAVTSEMPTAEPNHLEVTTEVDDETAVAIDDGSLEDVTALETELVIAEAKTEYTKVYYFLTEKIMTAEAVIAFLQENVPSVDVTPIVEYKTKLEELRSGLSAESDFEAVKQEAITLITDARETTQEIMQGNGIEHEDVVTAVQEYKTEETEDDEAKEQWADAREGYIHAKTTVVLARFNNFEKVSQRYGSVEQSEELQNLMAQLQVIAQQIAGAAGTFDKTQIEAYMAQAHSIVDQAKGVAKDMKESYHAEKKQEQETSKEEKNESKSNGKFGSAQAVDAEDNEENEDSSTTEDVNEDDSEDSEEAETEDADVEETEYQDSEETETEDADVEETEYQDSEETETEDSDGDERDTEDSEEDNDHEEKGKH